MNMSKCLTLLFAFLVSAQAAFALPLSGNLPDVVVEAVAAHKVSLQLTDLLDGATIRLVDGYGETLLKEDVQASEKNYGKIYNLEKLAEGKYLLVVAMNQKEVRQGLLIDKAGTVVVPADDRQVYLVPTIRLGDKFVDVNWFNGKESNMKVEVLSANGQIVFEEDLEKVAQVGRRYNVSKLAQGDYVFVVRTPYDAHYKRLVVE